MPRGLFSRSRIRINRASEFSVAGYGAINTKSLVNQYATRFLRWSGRAGAAGFAGAVVGLLALMLMFAMLAAVIEGVGAGGITLIVAFTFASIGVGAVSSAVVAAAIARINDASLAGAVFVSLLLSAYPAAAFYGFAVLATCCATGRGFWSAGDCGCH